jgi:hypothetical protein
VRSNTILRDGESQSISLSVNTAEFPSLITANMTNTANKANAVNVPNVQLAISIVDYRVTPGDIYTLAYAAGTTPVVYTVVVDPTYKLRVSNLGIIDIKGKTYIELKNQVETLVSKNYPMSGVQFVLTNPALFTVIVKGKFLRQGKNVPGLYHVCQIADLSRIELTRYVDARDVSGEKIYLTEKDVRGKGHFPK